MASALSGLTASGRTAELISNNIANALTENFGRRDLTLSSEVLGGYGSGVRVSNMTRAEDVVATASRRSMDSQAGYGGVLENVYSRISTALGGPGEAGALATLYTEFESAIVAAANNPSSTTHLDTAVRRAGDVANALQSQSGSIMQVRMETDASIAAQVQKLNESIAEIDRINIEIRKRFNSPNDIAGLQDTQNKLLDDISEIIPIKVAKRDLGEIAIFTPEGGVVLDGSPREFGFTPTPIITHAMTIANGGVSELTLNGQTVSIGTGNGYFEGGSLSALFEARDVILPGHNAQLDGLARDLVERFQSPTVDPTLAAADPGLFTDAGAQFASANELGFAGRIELNAAVDSGAGGYSWRLRDGLNAVSQGDVGDNGILRNLESALTQAVTPGASMGMATAQSAASFASDLSAQRFSDHSYHDEKLAYASSQVSILRGVESSSIGVDTDEQLQRLLETEKAYAANARVMSTLDGLLEELLRI